MIELKNVSKVYKSKKSIDTVALQDVTLKFNNSGMVFVVGKSGSGKSTLLNVLGGLDSVSSGDILVENRNLNELNNKDLDSYRNTYVGFIFQEFNILEEYNVNENIDLALRLQGKEKNKEEVLNILEKLDLKGLENRNINELSGGQKQRVAIGRAIIKNPKLILADEPTGNLDQNSGNQVFDILKSISKDRLVVVVSHNMEAAEKYADRIIEIQDGKVIRDTNNSQIISSEVLELKKSKLPFSYALKMALNGFKSKPFRFVMTIILTALSLVFMGVSLTLQLFDKDSLILNTIKDNKVLTYDVEKAIHNGIDVETLILESDDIDAISNIVDEEVNLVYDLYSDAELLNFEFGGKSGDGSSKSFYGNPISYIKVVDVKDNRIMGNIIGKVMENSDEIVIHKYLADYIIKFGVKCQDEIFKPKSYEELVNSNKYIKLGYNDIKIVGIVDDDDSIYKKAKEKDIFLDDKLYDYFKDNYVSKGHYIYTKDFVMSANLGDDKEKAYLNSVYVFGNDMAFDNLKVTSDEVMIEEINGKVVTRKLEKDEIVLSLKSFTDSIPFKNGLYEYLSNNENMTFKEAKFSYSLDYFKKNILNKRVIIQNKISGDRISLSISGLVDSDYSYITSKFLDDFTPRKSEVKSIQVYIDNYDGLNDVFSDLKFKKEVEEGDNKPQFVYSIDHQDEIYSVIFVYKETKIYVFCISIVFLIFAFMLFSNFIGVTITYSQKEIGILRALGARERDVFKIFGFESLIIAIISSIVGIFGWLTVCMILNSSIFGKLFFEFKGVVISPIVPVILVISIVFLALIITLGFINRISKIKPIDAILNK